MFVFARVCEYSDLIRARVVKTPLLSLQEQVSSAPFNRDHIFPHNSAMFDIFIHHSVMPSELFKTMPLIQPCYRSHCIGWWDLQSINWQRTSKDSNTYTGHEACLSHYNVMISYWEKASTELMPIPLYTWSGPWTKVIIQRNSWFGSHFLTSLLTCEQT